ncbi:MAG: DUF1501 domain-containing protein [Myxococcaceae bacterium]
MNSSRRRLLKWALGAGQVALLDRFGLLRSGTSWATPPADAPSRLCVLYVPGGFRPQFHFWPMEDADVDQVVPPPGDFSGEPVFFRASNLVDLGPANGNYKPLRTWRSWDPANPANRASGFSPMMYGYTHFDLAGQIAMLHGLDQGTADHTSAFVSAMCGVASPDFRAPALHAVAANFLHAKYSNTRPLPFVVVTSERGMPVAQGLPSHAAPVRVPSLEALVPQLSDDPMDNPWWTGLDQRAPSPELDVRGASLGSMLNTTPLEQYTLGQPGKLLGRSTANVDGFLEALHGSLRSVSRVLAADVVSVLNNTKGIDYLTTNWPPYMANYFTNAFTYTFGLANFHMTVMEPRLDMALRLLKADVTSAVHVALPLDFDTHSGLGQAFSCAHGRAHMDCIARFLGELKNTPAPGLPGKTLLDDTLVVVMSEFGRSWSYANGSGGFDLPDNHHPYTSVMFAGGNVAGNRQVGSYDRRGFGVPVELVEENGQASTRVPRSADAVTTAMRIMGLEFNEFFIPGGYGEVVGLRKS